MNDVGRRGIHMVQAPVQAVVFFVSLDVGFLKLSVHV
jgi:hypothetical protein